jgi:hypothetical protein
VDKYLGVSVNSFVKLLISDFSFIDVDLMRNNKARLGSARDDKVSKIAVIRLDIALARANGKSLFKELAKAKADHALSRCLIWSTRIARDVKAWDSETTTGPSNADHVLENNVGLFSIATVANSLIANSIDRSINFLPVIGLDDQVYRITLGEVNRRTANLFGRLETLGNAVHDKHPWGAAQDGWVCSHETYGASTKDSNALARSETGDFHTVPTSREDVSEENEISLMLFPSREFKSVKVSVWNSDVLSLTTSIRAHGYVAISTSSKSRVNASAESSFALFAITAAAVCDVEGHDDTVPFFEKSDTLAELLNYSHIFMAWKDQQVRRR